MDNTIAPTRTIAGLLNYFGKKMFINNQRLSILLLMKKGGTGQGLFHLRIVRNSYRKTLFGFLQLLSLADGIRFNDIILRVGNYL